MMRRLLLPAMLLLAALPARADDATDAIDRARQLYVAGDMKGASNELVYALREVDMRRRAGFQAFFPAAPEGWTLEPAEADSAGAALAAQMMGGGVIVERRYARTAGEVEAHITAQIMADSPMVQGLAAMVTNPMMMQPGDRRVRINGETALLRFDAEQKSGEITLVSGNSVIKLEGEGLTDANFLTELVKRFDLSRIRAAK
ncbi:hypothetical protein BKE38_10490 [Pseudoroseomonas deserti]|uniref:Uncharacterized protein n=1 Tax=Teichococcus deserti TaxID=1817963 RepID=A0A1V2H328_9PROT|nr:hypothetical protein [Pseudoroseomonas deserti]ONG54413.1 hypothetical protein BKE38_10490 [Pseudoroseomonas deserti]